MMILRLSRTVLGLLVCTLVLIASCGSAQNEPLRLLLIGDSNTQGVEGAYRPYLQDLLIKQGLKVDFIGGTSGHNLSLTPQGNKVDPEHESYAGYRIAQVFEKVQLHWPDYQQDPDIIFVMLGTNDLIAGSTDIFPMPAFDDNALVQAPESYIKLLTYLFRKAPKAKVFIANVLPVKQLDQVEDNKTRQALSAIEQQVNHFNKKFIATLLEHQAMQPFVAQITLVDMHAAFAENHNYPTLFHPGAEGYQTIAKVWFNTLNDKLTLNK